MKTIKVKDLRTGQMFKMADNEKAPTWVKVGEDYIDPTFELVLKKDVTKEAYAALGEYTYDYALSRMAEWGTYGDVYIQDNLRKIKNNKNND